MMDIPLATNSVSRESKDMIAKVVLEEVRSLLGCKDDPVPMCHAVNQAWYILGSYRFYFPREASEPASESDSSNS